MIAIVEIYGKQYKVSKGDTVVVDSKIDLETGKIVKFDNIKACLLYTSQSPRDRG